MDLVESVKAFQLLLFAAKGTNDTNAGQVFLHGNHQVALTLVGNAELLGQTRKEDARITGDDGNEAEGDDGQCAVHLRHEIEGR